MTSAPIRDPRSDHLLTPENAAFLIIDYQPSQLAGVRSMDQALLVENAVSTVRTIKAFGVPVVHSTINVATGRGGPTALREGYEVYPVVDAIGGTSPEAHRAGLDRVIQAGGQPISWVSLAVELQRDWARQETVEAVIEIVLTDRLLRQEQE
jgi:nicotinamidase-related amidase